MDRSRALPVPCQLDARPALARPRRADARSVSADAHLDRVGGSAGTDDNHFPKPRLLWQKNYPLSCTNAATKFEQQLLAGRPRGVFQFLWGRPSPCQPAQPLASEALA